MILPAQLTMPDEDVTMAKMNKVDGMEGMSLLAKTDRTTLCPIVGS